jgi:Matrixin
MDPSALRQELQWAFQVWQDNSKLRFTETGREQRGDVDINVGFHE